MIENNAENRKNLAMSQVDCMSMDELIRWAVEQIENSYVNDNEAFNDDWKAYMIQ